MSMMGDVSRVSSALANAVPSESKAAPPGEMNPPPLPQPAATWDDATTAALAALADFFAKTREGMREVKKAFDASRQAQMKEEVAAMREQADEIRSGAFVQAATLAASASCGAVSLATSDKTSAWFKWAGETSGKFQEPVKSVYEARAKDCEADATAARASADRSKTSAEDAQELADTQSELAGKAMDAIRAVLESRHAATMAVLMQRG